MSPFTFRLDPVLRVRVSQRDERQRELADALTRLREVEQAIATINAELARTRNERASDRNKLRVERLLAMDAYEAQLREQQELQQTLRDQAAALMAERREALLAADRAVRSLEMLRETELERHLAELRRRETRDLDELAGRPFSAS
ncbi:MAG TPA: flagellar export protein FliJ [Pirellulales bacterium]|jgi:flagellar export protein FliJ